MSQSKRRPVPEDGESKKISQKSHSSSAEVEGVGQGVTPESPVRKRWTRGRVYEYTPGSLWSHLRYGLGTLAVLVLPPLIPGVTGRGLVMGYMGLLEALYGIVCVWGIIYALRSPAGRTVTRR